MGIHCVFDVTCSQNELIGLIKTSGKHKNYELVEYVNDVNREYTEVLMELNINGIMDTSYSYGNERLTNERFTGWTGYYTYDPRGSVSGVTDREGMIWQSYRYDANGSMTFGKPQYNNVYGYNAESYNPNGDVQYLRARYYSPGTANFLTEDSYLGDIADPLTLNRYNYVKSSPLNYIDPSGHKIPDNFDTFGMPDNFLIFDFLYFNGTYSSENKKSKVGEDISFADDLVKRMACVSMGNINDQAILYPNLYGNMDFISNQRDYIADKIAFGLLGTIYANGYGSIAMYNVMHSFDDDITFADILRDIVKDSERLSLDHSGESTDQYPTMLDGLGGLNPFYVDEYLERKGYVVAGKTQMDFLFDGGRYDIGEHEGYITLYLWQSLDGEMGAHYEALIPLENGRLQGYNENQSYKDFAEYVQDKKDTEGLYWVNIYQIDKK